MTWFGWVFIGVVALSTLITVSKVGKRQEPTTGVAAAFVVVFNALFIVGVLAVGTGSL